MHEVLVKPAQCRRTRLIDRYLVIDRRQDNIKVRNGRLEVKQLVEQYGRFEAYRRKQRYPFPLAARAVLEIFPRLSEPERRFPASPSSRRRLTITATGSAVTRSARNDTSARWGG
jgi:hypothetical protein